MASYTAAFEAALLHAMRYEVGPFFKLDADTIAGKIDTREQRRKVGYVNDPDDAGGETKYGVAKNANRDLNITKLTWEQAKAVYYRRYWLEARCDQLPARVAVLHFDGAVNHGVKRANIFLQKALVVSPDGAIGPATLLKARMANPFTVDAEICRLREQFYRDIVASRPSQAKFLNGWLTRINEMRIFVLDKTRTFA